MAHSNLAQAKAAKNDEFYTQFRDIEREVNAYLEFNPDVFRDKSILLPCDDPYESNFFKFFAMRFNEFGLKKLVATCYAGSPIANTQLSLFDYESAENKTTKSPHKIEILEVTDANGVKTDNPWPENVMRLLRNQENALTRLRGDGDFRSDEVTKLRNEADIIITNPPFSLFREFLAWIEPPKKQFLIIGNPNAVTYKEIFSLIRENKIWWGMKSSGGENMYLDAPQDYTEAVVAKHPEGGAWWREENGKILIGIKTVWFTNLDHGRRHQELPLMTMADNLKHSKHKELRGKAAYDRYVNYNAIEVPFTDAIPSDYDGVMGVPITFLDKYNPEQFEIVDINPHFFGIVEQGLPKPYQLHISGKKDPYARILIRRKEAQ